MHEPAGERQNHFENTGPDAPLHRDELGPERRRLNLPPGSEPQNHRENTGPDAPRHLDELGPEAPRHRREDPAG
jgi:hypothetical protein